MSIIIKRRFVAENIADYLDNSFSNPYDRTFYASKEGRYIIKAKVHDLVIGNIIDTIEFELSDAEIMGFIRAVSEIKDKAQQSALLFLGITMPTSLGFITQHEALESFLTRQYERTRFAKLLGFTYTGDDSDYYYTLEHSLQSK